MDFKKLLNRSFRMLIPLFLGAALLWYLYQDQDLTAMWEVIKKGVRYDILLFSLLFGLGANIARGIRWGDLINSMGEKVNRRNAVLAVLGNYAINMALPRVGEIWRCGVIAKQEKISFTKLLGTLLVDRITDLFMMGLIVLSLFFFNIKFFSDFFSANPTIIGNLRTLFSSVWIYLALATIILLVWILFTRWGHLPLVQRVKSALLNIWTGTKTLWEMKHKWRFIFQTILIWTGYFLFFYITFYAFDFTRELGVRIGLIAFTMSSIGVAVPVQGGIGVWHFMVISTLVAFGVKENDAAAFALVVYTIQSLWTVLIGLTAVFSLPLLNKDKREIFTEDSLI